MSYTQGQMVALGVVFMVLPAAFVGLRVWARTLSKAGLAWDDYTIFIALAFAIAACIVQLIAAIDGQLGQHQTDAPDGSPILDDPRFLVYEKTKFALQIFGILGWGVTKMSVLLLYIRIFSIRKFRIVSQVGLGIVIAWTISFFFATLFQCYPITPLVEPFYGNSCIQTIPFWYAGGITDILLDFFILVLPIPMVISLQLPMKQKIAVVSMFLLGGLAVASSIVRLVEFFAVGAVLAVHFNDETYYTSPVFFWSVIELCLGIISACLPTLRPIFVKYQVFASTKQSNSSASSGKRNWRSARSSRIGYNRSNPADDGFEIPVLHSQSNTHGRGSVQEEPH